MLLPISPVKGMGLLGPGGRVQRCGHESKYVYLWDFEKVIVIGLWFGNEEGEEVGLDRTLEDLVCILY